jgi:4-hydroxybutyryl-CoA dehydratase / vinylacetyl-CoA-Delta-isomerase
MALRTPDEFRQSLRDGRSLYFRGERVADVTAHPVLRVGVESAAVDYQIAETPEYQDFAVVFDKDGQPSSRFFQAPRTADDLLKRHQLIETGSRICFGFPPFAKEGGSDALNAAAIVTSRVDKQFGTKYYERVEQFRRDVQDGDLSVAIAMTDVKGDRSLRPSEQADKDLYVRIVAEHLEGIVVRGAKAHITSSPYTNELLVLPCRNLTEADKDYAVAFTIPANAPGVKLIVSDTAASDRDLLDHPVSGSYHIIESLVVFEDVFVPFERVFLKREWQMAGLAAHMFANYHRMTAAAYKYPFAELLVGTAKLIAEYSGLDRITHIRDKLAWLVTYAETIRGLSRAACVNPARDEDTDMVYPDPVLGNAAKFYFAENYHQAVKLAQDIAGGIVVTTPSERDYQNVEIRPLIEKYLSGKAGVPAEYRIKAIKLIKDLVASDLGGYWEVTSIHAEGSLAAQRLAIYGSADFARYRSAAKRAARIEYAGDTIYNALGCWRDEKAGSSGVKN